MTDETLGDPFAETNDPVFDEKPKRTRRRKADPEPDPVDVFARDPLHEPGVDGLVGTWRPDGGPEMNRWDAELTPEILDRFRAHCVTGGHQKRPDQSRYDADGWYIHPPRADGDAKCARYVAKLRGMVADTKLFDRLMVDDGTCGGAKWVVAGQRVTSTSIWSAFYACRILELTEGLDVRSVVDIGGGYGHLAHVLAEFFPAVTVVELPIVMQLARRWSEAHPATADKVTLCHPYEEWAGDLLINTHSFQHMTEANLRWYDAQFQARPPAAMYLVNRVVKGPNTDIVFSEYPWLKRYRTESERMITQSHVEWFGVMGGRNG